MASEYLKWKYRDVKPDPPVQYTKRQKAANWWHYHWGMLLVCAVLLIMLIDIGKDVLRIGHVEPDFQLAFVSSIPLGEETRSTWERSLAAYGEDVNGDGRVTVQLNAYLFPLSAEGDSDLAQYAAAAKVRLMADLENADSAFFLLEFPETFHSDYQILAKEDGTLADDGGQIMYLPWTDCPALLTLSPQPAAPERLFLARRGYWEDHIPAGKSQQDAFWARLTEGANQ